MQKSLRTAVTIGIATSIVGGVGALFVSSVRPASATPAFAAKEAKPCGYCHVRASGGGARNYRGKYYHGHSNTFAEFDDEAEAKAAGEPVGPDPEPKPKSWTAPKAPAGDPGTPTTPPPATTPPTTPPAPATPPAPTVAELTAKSKTVEAAYKKSPKNPALKKAYAASLADLAHATMLDQTIPPKKRYPDALTLTRKALALDPTNKSAATDKKLIEDAYKSMGRPIPK